MIDTNSPLADQAGGQSPTKARALCIAGTAGTTKHCACVGLIDSAATNKSNPAPIATLKGNTPTASIRTHLQSLSASSLTAGAAGCLNFIQSGERPYSEDRLALTG